ncbi:WD40/YVTN/BNR-like repeat-containing protein, partial [Patulibacter sp. S7RM1-6]
PAATTWAGWDAPGPVGVGAPAHVSAYGGTTAVLGAVGDPHWDSAPLFVTGAAGSRIGRVPLTEGGSGAKPQLALAGPDRLLLAENCRVRRSDDLGATWSGDPLPSCASGTPALTTLDARVAWASLPTRTWRTVDGGATWTVVNAAEPGPSLATGEATGFRVVAAGEAGNALQRTADGGASWQGLKVPGPTTDA